MSNSTANDDDGGVSQKSSLAYTFSLNVIIFAGLILFFELNRSLPRLFLKRLRKSFEVEDRVPGRPPRHLFGWIRHVMAVSNSEFLRMIGLDGYMLLRYILICFKFCSFGTVFGLAILVPIYGNGSQGLGGWQQYTLANVVSSGEVTTDALWLPAAFSYMYLAYALYLLHAEFEHFVLKRLEFLIQGDPDTFQQTHYTIMIENVPPPLRSVTTLSAFFDKLFPGEVYSAEVMLQLNDLEEIRDERSQTRARLEKATAMLKATDSRPRITVSAKTVKALTAAISASIGREAASSSPTSTPLAGAAANPPATRYVVPDCNLDVRPHCCQGYFTVDAISYFTHLLFQQNITVSAAQAEYLGQMESTEREHEDHTSRAEMIMDFTTENIYRAQSELANKVTSPFIKTSRGLWEKITHRNGDGKGEGEEEEGGGEREEWVDCEQDGGGGQHELTPTSSICSVDNSIHSPLISNAGATVGAINTTTGSTTAGSSEQPSTNTERASSTASSSSSLSNSLSHTQSVSSAGSSTFGGDQTFQPFNHEQWRGKKKASGAAEDNEQEDLTPPPSPYTSRGGEGGLNGVLHMKKKKQQQGGGREERNEAKSEKGRGNSRGSQDRESEGGGGVGGNIKQVVGDVATGLGASISVFSNQGLKTARVAGKGAIRSVLEATRTLELLTLGAYYTTSSTAFVTFKTRSARSISCQMLLSHEHYRMQVERAPNTADIIWDNVSIPSAQITARQSISGYSFNLMAIFWSGVVTFIVNFTDLDKLSNKYDWVANLNLREFAFYDFLNQYLAVVVLLLIITLLPFLFDFVARHYEGLKRESDVQQSIMTRFFYYQLVNVYVTVASGTIVNSIQEILDHPRSLLSILGEQLPQVSIFFANLLLVKTLVSVPIEMLRIWPLLQVYAVKYFRNKKKLTRRELREGAFADLPLDYGWIYPNLLFVMMITATYSCISPCIMPISMVYYGFVYLMYKYQLLYVYINKYQAGGYMWYAVFDRSMIILFCGSLVLLSYLGISKTFQTGPFYLILPQPLAILYFWTYCNRKFIRPSAALSLECTKAIDAINAKLMSLNQETPLTYFDSDVYRQPALVEPFLKPEAYRNKSMGGGGPPMRQISSDTVSSPGTEEQVTLGLEAVEEGRESIAGDSNHNSIRSTRSNSSRRSLQRGSSSSSGDFSSPCLSPSSLEEGERGYDGDTGSQSQYFQQSVEGGRLRSVQEVDESMVEDDIDLLLSTGTGEGENDEDVDRDSQFEKLSDRRSTYNSYGTTDRTFIKSHPRRSHSSNVNDHMEDKRRRESK